MRAINSGLLKYAQIERTDSLPARYRQSATSETVFILCFFDDKIFAAAFGTKTIKQTQISVKCAYMTNVFYCIILVKTEECA